MNYSHSLYPTEKTNKQTNNKTLKQSLLHHQFFLSLKLFKTTTCSNVYHLKKNPLNSYSLPSNVYFSSPLFSKNSQVIYTQCLHIVFSLFFKNNYLNLIYTKELFLLAWVVKQKMHSWTQYSTYQVFINNIESVILLLCVAPLH